MTLIDFMVFSHDFYNFLEVSQKNCHVLFLDLQWFNVLTTVIYYFWFYGLLLMLLYSFFHTISTDIFYDDGFINVVLAEFIN